MSRAPEEPTPPRRPRPKSPRPDPDPEPPTTFRPNPSKSAPGDSHTFATPLPPKKTTTRFAAQDPDRPERIPGGPGFGERIFFGGVGSGQLAAFCRQCASYLDAGVDLRKAFANLERQYARTGLGPVIGRLHLAVKRGDTLADAVAREPQAFDALFVAMIKVAEARGGTPETLKMLSRHYEGRQTLIRQARSAMIYPVSLLLIAAAVVTLLTVWVLPMFTGMLQEFAGKSTPLPLPSRVLMAFSRFVSSGGWWVMPAVAVAVPVLLFQAHKTAVGRRVMDRAVLWVPVLGQVLSKLDVTRFARSLSTLLGSGVDVGTSLDLTADVMQLEPYRSAVRNSRGAVLEGEFLSEALDASRRFGPDVISIIESGEETGKLPEALQHLADDYEEQVSYMIKNMGQLIQPLVMIMMGGLVLFIILAVLLPYIAILTSLGS